MTPVETILSAHLSAHHELKEIGGRYSVAKRWAKTHPDRFPPEELARLEAAFKAAQAKLAEVNLGTGQLARQLRAA